MGISKKIIPPANPQTYYFGFAVAVSNNLMAISAGDSEFSSNPGGYLFNYGVDIGGVRNWGFIERYDNPGYNGMIQSTAIYENTIIGGNKYNAVILQLE